MTLEWVILLIYIILANSCVLLISLRNHLSQDLQGWILTERILNYRIVSQKIKHSDENKIQKDVLCIQKHASRKSATLVILIYAQMFII